MPGIDGGPAQRLGDEPGQRQRRREHQQHVAQHRRHLRAHQVGDLVHEVLHGRVVVQSLSLAAMAGAVMAGCLVATVKCSSWISTKLMA
jgi:DNA-binding transcriptional LysR family regulator